MYVKRQIPAWQGLMIKARTLEGRGGISFVMANFRHILPS